MKARMYERFLSKYKIDGSTDSPDSTPSAQCSITGWDELFLFGNGASFNQGVYRIIWSDELSIWKKLISSVFPNFADRIIPFGYDWLGRFFALDKDRMNQGQPLILLFSPFSNEVLELPANVVEFHNNILVNQSEPAVEKSLFESFLNENKIERIEHDFCADLTVPLYLGGKFHVGNMEVMNLQQYWQITADILRQIDKLPAGTSIRNVRLS